MFDFINQEFIEIWEKRGIDILFFLLKRWYLLLSALIIGGAIGYFTAPVIKPTYTANISFVLSTGDARGGGLSGLAAQLGFDGGGSVGDNIFSGDNIIELFKSRSLIGTALLTEVDTSTHQTLLNYITKTKYAAFYKANGPFNNSPKTYNKAQTGLYRAIISDVGGSFIVFKKDKKLIFYLISATSTDSNIAYYIAKCMLQETAQYFIETKTTVTAGSVVLLQHEADSLGGLLRNAYNSSATMIDRTYNLNPSITVQRSGSLFAQTQASAFSAAYIEVMRNLEIAKINLQKETPLYKVIDEPELPLSPSKVSILPYIIRITILFFLLIFILLLSFSTYKIVKIDVRNAK